MPKVADTEQRLYQGDTLMIRNALKWAISRPFSSLYRDTVLADTALRSKCIVSLTFLGVPTDTVRMGRRAASKNAPLQRGIDLIVAPRRRFLAAGILPLRKRPRSEIRHGDI
jgi:hypothetical protein